jgi:hypothetical protein
MTDNARLLGMAALAVVILTTPACRQDDAAAKEEGDDTQVVPIANAVEADDYVFDVAGATSITLGSGSISASGSGVTVDGTTAKITRAGTYIIQGVLTDGQIKVDAGASAKVKMVLNGVDITTADDAPIFIKNASKAVIYLQPGTVNTLTDGSASTRDGAIHCKTRLSIFGGGTLNVTGNVDDGINAQGGIVIEEGVFTVKSLESGIKSDINIIVNGGKYSINAGNDGMHGEQTLTVNGGTIDVTRSVEGLEASTITMTGGSVHILSSDDGVNAASNLMGDTNRLFMKGGYLYVNANGDGLDINGPVEMSGGTVIVDGPTANNNGALDYTGSFNMTGGYLLAVGSSGMPQAPSRTSTVNSVAIAFAAAQQAGVLVHITGPNGADVLTYKPAKRYQTVVLSSTALVPGGTYSLYTGGNATGTPTDGLFTAGGYYGGALKTTFTVSGSTTVVNVN